MWSDGIRTRFELNWPSERHYDIGKVPEEETESPHAILGMEWAEKYGEKKEVCNAIGAHHDEIEMTSLFLLSFRFVMPFLVRDLEPDGRFDSYVQRLKDLENIAYDFNGVNKAYAIQAGRELRVIVEVKKFPMTKLLNCHFKSRKKFKLT